MTCYLVPYLKYHVDIQVNPQYPQNCFWLVGSCIFKTAIHIRLKKNKMDSDLESLLIYCYVSWSMTNFWFVFEPQILLRYAVDILYSNMCLKKLIPVAPELLLAQEYYTVSVTSCSVAAVFSWHIHGVCLFTVTLFSYCQILLWNEWSLWYRTLFIILILNPYFMSLCEVISHCSLEVGSNYAIVWFFTLIDMAFFAENKPLNIQPKFSLCCGNVCVYEKHAMKARFCTSTRLKCGRTVGTCFICWEMYNLKFSLLA